MAVATHYDALDVEPTASADQVKKAYRRLVRTAHPDHGGTAAAFHAVQMAYEVLRDPAKRAEYDRTLRSGPTTTPGPGPDFFARAAYERAQAEAARRKQEAAERAAAQQNARYHPRGTVGPDGEPLTHAQRVEVEVEAMVTLDGHPRLRWYAPERLARMRENRARARAAAASFRRPAPVALLAVPLLLLAGAYLVRLSAFPEQLFASPEGSRMRLGPVLVGNYYAMGGQLETRTHVSNAVVGVILVALMWSAARIRSTAGPVRHWFGILPAWLCVAAMFAAIEHLMINGYMVWASMAPLGYALWLWVLRKVGAPLSERGWASQREWFAEAVEELRLFGTEAVAARVRRVAGARGERLVRRLAGVSR